MSRQSRRKRAFYRWFKRPRKFLRFVSQGTMLH